MTAMPGDAPLYDISTREGYLRRAMDLADRRVPPRFRHATASHPDVAAWRDGFGESSPSLLIRGPTGTGKTHQAYGVIRDLAAAGVTVEWSAMTGPDMFASLRPREGADTEATFGRLANVALLLLDDIGAAKASEWTEEILFRLINHRYEAMLPGIFTSNVPAGELRDVLGARVASRLAEMCTQVALRGPDRRRTS
jgi:DNA replication protein DnaC